MASERLVEASARRTRDSVLHFAAAKPDHAAISATIESRTASMIETLIHPRASSTSAALACSLISLPTSCGESPSGMPGQYP